MDMPHANSDKMDTFLRDAGMDTPEVLEIMKEVLQPSVGDTNNNFGAKATYVPRYAFKALIYGAPEVMDQLCGRLDVTSRSIIMLSSTASCTTRTPTQAQLYPG